MYHSLRRNVKLSKQFISCTNQGALSNVVLRWYNKKPDQWYVPVTSKCLCCKETHPFYKCSSFWAMDSQWLSLCVWSFSFSLWSRLNFVITACIETSFHKCLASQHWKTKPLHALCNRNEALQILFLSLKPWCIHTAANVVPVISNFLVIVCMGLVYAFHELKFLNGMLTPNIFTRSVWKGSLHIAKLEPYQRVSLHSVPAKWYVIYQCAFKCK